MVEFLIFAFGCFLGGLATYIAVRRRKVGTLRFYKIDPSESPVMTAVLDRTPDEIGKRSYAIFHVSHE